MSEPGDASKDATTPLPGTEGPSRELPSTEPPGAKWPDTEPPSAASPGDHWPDDALPVDHHDTPYQPDSGLHPDSPGDGGADGAEPPDGEQPTATPTDGGGRKRRRRLVLWGVAGAVILVIFLGCMTAGLVVRSGLEWITDSGQDDRNGTRLQQSCLELEERLNRLAPPGATGGDPRRRADAIRDENAAVRPLLDELAAMDADHKQDRDEDRERWAADWRRLVAARGTYADGLDRRAAGGEPAFFLDPLNRDGDPVADELADDGPATCAGPLHRLAAPDL